MSPRPLPDAEARRRIRTELERNFLVEAAAGAGKTHALVGRIVALVTRGAADVEGVAAVTFTRKAAGEMRGRLLSRLEEAREERSRRLAAGESSHPARERRELRRIDDALRRFERSFVGTVHSFCARLLRERPVEAGVEPGFTEVDEGEESLLRREAWDHYVAGQMEADTGRLRALEEVGLDPEQLYPTFERLCAYPEVEVPAPDVPRPDLEEPARRVTRFLRSGLEELPASPPEGGHDDLQRTLFAAASFLRNRDLATDPERAELLELFETGASVTLNRWGSQERGREVRERFETMRARWVEEPLRRWREHRYGPAMEFLRPAVAHYREERRAAGTLNFQDLLLEATRLLRENPDVRRHLRERFTHLLVDEFQDTDPVQAELLFLLAAEDPEERDWTAARPEPGRLFLVGDPKQSIYRFRRADIDVYRLARDRIEATGGETLRLHSSFRSLPGVVRWVNRGLGPLFEAGEAEVQPAYAPLEAVREGAGDGGDGTPRVRRLALEKVPGNPPTGVAREDAGRIADWISAALDGGAGGLPDGDSDPTPGDFLVLLRQKKHLSVYARALEERGVPYEVTGGGALSESEELDALLEMVRAALTPDDPLALAAYLRGPLVGASDDELYRFRRAGGRWSFRREPPPFEGRGRFVDAFTVLEEAARTLRSLPPAAALERILERTGLLAAAAGRELGSSRAGSLFRVLSLVQGWQAEGQDIALVLDELEDLAEESDVDERTLEAGRGGAVRVMNLHKAKGLEGRVVFLADPVKEPPDYTLHRVERARDGGGPRGHFVVSGPNPWGGPGRPLALPPDWRELEAEEERYRRAEEDRLLYVAATRARDLLVVSHYPHSDRGPWTRLYPAVEEAPELEVPDGAGRRGEGDGRGQSRRPGDGPGSADPDSAGSGSPAPVPEPEELERRWERAAAPTFRVRRISDLGRRDPGEPASREGERGPDEDPSLPGGRRRETGGAPFGRAVHRLLQEAAEAGPSTFDLGRAARRIAASEELSPAWISELLRAVKRVRERDFWREAMDAERRLAEVRLAGAEDGELVRGVVDLAYRSGGAWTLVDYKTNRASGRAAVQRLTEQYRPQLLAYRREWRRATGEEVARCGLFFTDPGRWVEVEP